VKSIAPNILAWFEALAIGPPINADFNLNFCRDIGSIDFGVSVRHMSFNKTYKADGADNIIDENIIFRIKLANETQIDDAFDNISAAIIGHKIEDADIEVLECSLTSDGTILKEREGVLYKTTTFRFVGRFLN